MAGKTTYGPVNPHPLSTLKTELVWEGKYDEYGNRRTVDIAGCSMPMQKIETIDEPRRQAIADGKLSLFEKEIRAKRTDDFRNMLIWGDNKLVMASLLKDFKGKIDLIYIDPPFDVGMDFTCDVLLGDQEDKFTKDQSALEMVAYKDTWGCGVDSYLHMMNERLTFMSELLSERGSIFLHCDWHVGHYLRCLLNEILGKANFLNEIVWYYYNKLHDSRKRVLPRAHDVIFRYAKVAGHHIHNHLEEKRDKPVKKLRYHKVNGQVQNIIGEDGKAETYIREVRTVDDIWRIRCLQPANKEEYTQFTTQKPIDLIERIIDLATLEDSIVFDAFCGTGTTLLAAENKSKKWLGCDLGRYERQWWQKERLHNADEEHRKVVLEFFKAEVLQNAPSPLIHGRKAGAFCHVDGIDSVFDRNEAREVAKAVAQSGAKECYVLAWEFEMDLRLTTAALEKELGVKLMLIQIPREIMEKNRKNPPPFLEMAVLEAQPVYKGKGTEKTVDIKITKFMPSLAEVPSKELEALKERAIRSGIDFIDFWAVDFDWQPGKPFNHHWQDYRTRKDRSLKTVSDAGYKYPKPGTYTVCVKVVDTFGCDSSITVEVKI